VTICNLWVFYVLFAMLEHDIWVPLIFRPIPLTQPV